VNFHLEKGFDNERTHIGQYMATLKFWDVIEKKAENKKLA